MYIPANNYITPGLRVSFIHSLHNDKSYSIKNLRKIDERLARDYSQTQLYGGSFKSFWKKVSNIGKKVLNAPSKIASKIYPFMKKGIDFLAKNDTAQDIIKSIPKAGPIISEGVKQLSKITDTTDKIIENIRNKNPSVAFNEAKNLVTNVRDAVKDVSDKANISDEQKQKIKDNTDKVYNALPSLIKSEGLEKVEKAAGYLPFLDSATMKITERTGKNGGALKPRIRFTKPRIITQHADIFKKHKIPDYNPEIIGTVGGVLFGKNNGKPRLSFKDDAEKEDFMNYHKKKNEERKASDNEKMKQGMTFMTNRVQNDYDDYMKNKKSGRAGRAGRANLAGADDDDDADAFIESVRNKMKIKKTK